MLQPLNTITGYFFPLLIRAHPKLGVNLVLWNDITTKDIPHEQIVVHGLGYNLGHR